MRIRIKRYKKLLVNYKVKISCFFIAVLIWLFVVTGNRYYKLFSIPIKINDHPKGYVLSQPIPESVEVAFYGTGRGLISLALSEKNVELNLGDDESERDFMISTDMITGIPSDLNIETAGIIGPDTVKVRMEPKSSRLVKVEPQLVLETMDGYIQVGPVHLEPDSIMINGPASLVDRIDVIYTEKKNYHDLFRDFSNQIALMPPAERMVRYASSHVKFAVDIQRIHERTFRGIPIDVINVPSNIRKVEAVPSTLTLILHGGVDALQAIKPEDLRATIDYRKYRRRNGEASAFFTLPDEVIYYESKPKTFTLLIEQ